MFYKIALDGLGRDLHNPKKYTLDELPKVGQIIGNFGPTRYKVISKEVNAEMARLVLEGDYFPVDIWPLKIGKVLETW